MTMAYSNRDIYGFLTIFSDFQLPCPQREVFWWITHSFSIGDSGRSLLCVGRIGKQCTWTDTIFSTGYNLVWYWPVDTIEESNTKSTYRGVNDQLNPPISPGSVRPVLGGATLSTQSASNWRLFAGLVRDRQWLYYR